MVMEIGLGYDLLSTSPQFFYVPMGKGLDDTATIGDTGLNMD